MVHLFNRADHRRKTLAAGLDNLVREDWLMKLPRGQGFLYASGYTYKTRFPLLPEPRHRFPLERS